MSGPYDHTKETEYKAYTHHLSTCEACDDPDDDDYICPEGLRLKHAWLDDA